MPLVTKIIKNKDGEIRYRVINFRGDEGLVEVDAIGTGCIIIHRRVLEHPKMKSPFTDYFDKDGLRFEGLDLSFCRRAKELGFKVYAHLDYPCSHWTYADLKEIYMGITGEKKIF